MDVFPKFIIETDEVEGDCLIIAKCTYHKDLACFTDKVKGGGNWKLDRETKTFTLYGKSDDFGACNIKDIAHCIIREKVFSSKSLVRNFCEDGFKFLYQTDRGAILDLASATVSSFNHGTVFKVTNSKARLVRNFHFGNGEIVTVLDYFEGDSSNGEKDSYRCISEEGSTWIVEQVYRLEFIKE
jgi:hypothetical protein